MISPNHRSITTCLVVVLLGLLLTTSCGDTKSNTNASPQPDAKTDPKAEFVRSLKGGQCEWV